MLRGFSKGDAVEEAKYWLEVLDLWSVRNRMARALSGGQRKRVAVAMVLATGRPSLRRGEAANYGVSGGAR